MLRAARSWQARRIPPGTRREPWRSLLRGPRRLVLVRLVDGRLTSLPLLSQTGQPLVDVRLTNAGLFFAYNVKKTAQKGRLAFVSTATLLRRF